MGRYAFCAGLVIAIIAGFGAVDQPWVPWVLAAIGLVAGVLNVNNNENQGFLIAGIALLASATATSGLPVVGEHITYILAYISIFVATAVLIVALKSLFDTAQG